MVEDFIKWCENRQIPIFELVILLKWSQRYEAKDPYLKTVFDVKELPEELVSKWDKFERWIAFLFGVCIGVIIGIILLNILGVV
ncbi:MAG: hypothetical protein Q8S32_12185 [Burkholderiaceae bacterium]|nr:hypothetical protein [Burkholderiaceae bacterium]